MKNIRVAFCVAILSMTAVMLLSPVVMAEGTEKSNSQNDGWVEGEEDQGVKQNIDDADKGLENKQKKDKSLKEMKDAAERAYIMQKRSSPPVIR